MSSGPSTFGIMITSSLSPTSVTSGRRGRRGAHGESSAVDPGPELGARRSRRSWRPRRGRPGPLPCRWAGTPSSRLAKQHVDGGGQLGQLGDHLGVRRREEVDHPRGPERDLPRRGRAPPRGGAEEVLGGSHGPHPREELGLALRLAGPCAQRGRRVLGTSSRPCRWPGPATASRPAVCARARTTPPCRRRPRRPPVPRGGPGDRPPARPRPTRSRADKEARLKPSSGGMSLSVHT